MKSKLLWLGLALLPFVVWAANELTLTYDINYAKSGAVIKNNSVLGITVTGEAIASGVKLIDTNDTALALGDVTSNGFVFVQNLSTNSWAIIRVGVTNDFYAIRLKTNDVSIFRMDGKVLHAVTTSNSAYLNYIVFSE